MIKMNGYDNPRHIVVDVMDRDFADIVKKNNEAKRKK